MTDAVRVLVVTDSDSYVKWGAALAGQLPKDWNARLVVARSNALPSRRQIEAAVEGTRFEDDDVAVVGVAELTSLLRGWRPDVLLAAARGHTVQAAVSLVENVPHRPVLVSGLAGIAVPVLPYGLGFRRSVDIFVVHSRRELRAFRRASGQLGVVHGYELATMPFIDHEPVAAGVDAMHASAGAAPVRDRVVFAAQAQVPSGRRERAWLAERLVATARANPGLEVVVKVRAQAGEAQTHHEQVPYEDLLAALAEARPLPSNLVVESGSMRAQLRRAVGFVTVSSTAVLEAIAADVPVLALDDFGVGAPQINAVLRGSGLLGSMEDLLELRFRRPDAQWLEDNYFHDPAENTWAARVEELVQQRSHLGLLPYREQPGGVADRLRAELYRDVAFSARSGSRRDRAEPLVLRAVSWAVRRRAWLRRLTSAR